MRQPRQSHTWQIGLTLGAAVVSFFVFGSSTVVQTQAGRGAGAAPPQGGAPAGPGGGRGGANSELADFGPKQPYLPRTPADEAKGFRLPTGYRLELVASDPDIINPVAV
jgi:hypothetical protein